MLWDSAYDDAINTWIAKGTDRYGCYRKVELKKIMCFDENLSPKPVRVIFNDPATVVLWSDGKKTVVKCHNEAFDTEKGFAMAIVKRFMPRADFNRLLNDEIDRRVKRTHKGGKG